MDADFYYDLPGNHDAYNDATFAYYRANSVQGRVTRGTQVSWTRPFTFGLYHFVGVNTAGNNGAPFSIFEPWGDYAGLDSSELGFINEQLEANRSAALTLMFGHHPVTDTGVSDDTWLGYGHREFIASLDSYGASTYNYGHTHRSSQALFKGDSYTGVMGGGGIHYLNVASLGKSSSSNYSVIAIDCNGISAVTPTTSTWPVVVITAPVDRYLGTAVNPYSYSVPNASANPLRALVFDAGTLSQVSFRVDGATVWQPMSRVPGNSALWSATWDASALAAGDHTLEVRAIGSTTKTDAITVNVTATANRPPVAANDSYTTAQNATLAIVAPGVLSNDSDPDGDTLMVSAAASTVHGSLTLNTDGSFTYMPTAGYSGTDSFTYTASDGTANSTATVTITITASIPTVDTVVVTAATYASKTKRLSVTATSSAQPNAVLTVVGYGQMTYKPKSKSYTYQGTVTPKPTTVTVTSSLGGTDSRAVPGK
jgi:VCBS repeat-containing protein